MALGWHWAISKMCLCAKSPTGRVKATPKCLAVMQLNFGNGFLYKLVFHLRHSQQIGEHNGNCLYPKEACSSFETSHRQTH